MAAASDLIPLDGSTLPKPRGWRMHSVLDPSQPLALTLHLRGGGSITPLPADEDELSLLEFEQFFSASDEDIDVVVDFLRDQGFVEIEPKSKQCLIEAVGTAGQCNNAFGIELHVYDSRRGRYFGHEGEIKIPEHLDGIVETIVGLDNLIRLMRVRAEEYEPEQLEEYKPVASKSETDKPDSKPEEDEYIDVELPPSLGYTAVVASSAEQVQQTVEAAPIETEIPEEYVLYDPKQVAEFYNFPKGLDGSGQTIGIISLDGVFDDDDLDQYFREQGIPKPNIEVVTIPSKNGRGPRSFADDFELTMDIEVAGSVAPGADLVVFRVSRKAEQPYLSALKCAILHPSRPSIVTISYGNAEGLFQKRNLLKANQFLEYATTIGRITICAASGDGGSGTRDHDKMKPGVHVNFPASSPYVLACGGTAIETDENHERITREFAWNDHDQCRLATAGGISSVYQRPDYQKDCDLPPNKSDTVEFDGRGVPDVAASACLSSGYRVLFRGRWWPNGGTSAAAPMWAGLIARLNQGLNRRLGFIHPHLYELAGTEALTDITEGSNGYYKSACGWDACTGIGTPNGQAIFDALKKKLGIRAKDPDDDNENNDDPTTPPQKSTDDNLEALIASAQRSAMMAQNAARLAQQQQRGY